MSGVIVYSELRYDIFQQHRLVRDLILLEQPTSGSELSAYICGFGERRYLWEPNEEIVVDLKQVIIEFYDNKDRLIAIATLDSDSNKLTSPPRGTEPGYRTFDLNGTLAVPSDMDTAKYLLQQIQREYSDPAISGEIHADVVHVVEIAEAFNSHLETISESGTISENIYIKMSHEVNGEPRYASVYSSEYSSTDSKLLPDWTYSITPSIGAVLWLVGIIMIRKYLYGRMAVSRVPVINHMAV